MEEWRWGNKISAFFLDVVSIVTMNISVTDKTTTTTTIIIIINNNNMKNNNRSKFS
jgi:hypothetical protein